MKKNFNVLPPTVKYGFWGTCKTARYNTPLVWDATSRYLMNKFELTNVQTRDLLDSRTGRYFADDFTTIDSSRPASAKDVVKRLNKTLAEDNNKWFLDDVASVKSGQLDLS